MCLILYNNTMLCNCMCPTVICVLYIKANYANIMTCKIYLKYNTIGSNILFDTTLTISNNFKGTL